jgi:hypothetical protein
VRALVSGIGRCLQFATLLSEHAHTEPHAPHSLITQTNRFSGAVATAGYPTS